MSIIQNNNMLHFLEAYIYLLGSNRKKTSHRVRRLPLGGGGHMSIGVQSEAGGVVAQHAADGFYIHAVLQRQCGEGVPEVMESNFG